MKLTVVATNRLRTGFRVSLLARSVAPANLRIVAWAAWLSVPLLATVLAAIWTWLRGRPPAPLDTDAAIRAHQRYLDALTVPARGDARAPHDRNGDDDDGAPRSDD
jgi:hypothetical protein